MKFESILSEAHRNVATNVSRGIITAISLAVCVSLAIVVQVGGLVNVALQANDYILSGSAVQTITDDDQISGEICDGLASIDGINKSGAISLAKDSITAYTLPQSPIPQGNISYGFVQMLDLIAESRETAGVYISSTVANRLGKTAGESFRLNDLTEVHIRGVFNYPDDGRQSGLGYIILSPVSNISQNFSSCQAQIWPQNDSLTALLWTTIKNNGSDTSKITDKAEIKQLNSNNGSHFNGYNLYKTSLIWLTPLFLILISAALGIVFVRLRRLELSSALHIGMKRADLMKILLIEMLYPLTISIMISLLAFFIITYPIVDDKLAYFLPVLRLDIALAFGFIAGTLASTIRTKEKHLFKYFKER